MSTYKLHGISNILMVVFQLGITGTAINQTVLAETKDIVEFDKYVVTGSYIPRPEMDSISPVAIIGREKIERSGATTMNELFKKNIFTTAGTIDETFLATGAPASAGINLRGIGLSRTLVLLDGRRLPIFPFAQTQPNIASSDSFVDINLIPLGAVERIEILKDGASALYGADAVAGVVNIITRKEYDGAMLSGQYGGTLRGDGEEGQFNLLSGFSNQSTNVAFALDYLNRSEVNAKKRSISETANGPVDDRSNNGSPGTIRRADGSREPDDRCRPENIVGGRCKYDFAPFATLIPEVERTGLLLSFDHDITDNLQGFVRGTYTHSESERSLAAASPATPTSPNYFSIAPDNPNKDHPYPGEAIRSEYRLVELGPRIDEFTTDAFNIVSGLKTSIDSWDFEIAYGMGEVDTYINGDSGYALRSALDVLVNNGTLNPFGDSPNFNPRDVSYQYRRDGMSRMYTVDVKANGDLIELPHGMLRMAVGSDYRKEEFSDQFDSVSTSGDVIGVGGTSGEGRRDVFSAYLEFEVPVWENILMQIAGRMDHYSDFGETFNPKGSIRWQPFENLTLRANAGTGFKAPALHELHLGESFGFESVFDPQTGQPVTVPYLSFGNKNLEAEESSTWGAGFSWDVVDDWNVSFDYWRIENENAVLSSPQFYVDNASQFPGNVIRRPDDSIAVIMSPFENVAAQKIWGIDLASQYSWECDCIGEIRLIGNATYLGQFEQQPAPGASYRQLAGKDGNPQWRARGSVVWNKSDYEASLSVNHVDRYERSTSMTQVGSWTTFDAQVVWRPMFNLGGTVTLGVDNLFDREPPLDPNYEAWPFFNRALHNPRGRYLYAGYKYEF